MYVGYSVDVSSGDGSVDSHGMVVLMVVLVVVIFLIVASGCDGVGYSVDDGCVSSGDGSVDSHGSGGVDGRAGGSDIFDCC